MRRRVRGFGAARESRRSANIPPRRASCNAGDKRVAGDQSGLPYSTSGRTASGMIPRYTQTNSISTTGPQASVSSISPVAAGRTDWGRSSSASSTGARDHLILCCSSSGMKRGSARKSSKSGRILKLRCARRIAGCVSEARPSHMNAESRCPSHACRRPACSGLGSSPVVPVNRASRA